MERWHLFISYGPDAQTVTSFLATEAIAYATADECRKMRGVTAAKVVRQQQAAA